MPQRIDDEWEILLHQLSSVYYERQKSISLHSPARNRGPDLREQLIEFGIDAAGAAFERPRNVPWKELRVLVVDDEPLARRVLLEGLSPMENVQVVGEADSGETALRQIRHLKPDLVLLDIQMPVMDGFEVIRRLRGPLPTIVFVTAYSEHALDAFKVGAVDYLLKPVSEGRLRTALDRARRARRRPLQCALRVERTLSALDRGKARPVTKLVARHAEDYYLLDLDDVYALQADGEIVWVLTARGKYRAVHSLGRLAERLRGTQFERVHRSVLVNTNRIRKLSALSSRRWLLTLTNGLQFIVSKRRAPLVRDLLL